MFTDYYNEIDPAASSWLTELVDNGDLPFGFVDCRDIKTVVPGDLTYYDQCHFFAGIGGWALACKLADWSGPIWTASLPCQPFSQAGAQRGTDDPRHLWPAFRDLVAQCLPPVLVGEQVASKAGRAWLAAVRADLEALGYAVGAADLCAAGVGAPHIRQRLYWVAHHSCQGLEVLREQSAWGQRETAERGCEVGGLGQSDSPGPFSGREAPETLGHGGAAEPTGTAGGMGNSDSQRRQQIAGGTPCDEETHRRARWDWGEPRGDNESSGSGKNRWSNVVYLPCADGKARPVEPGIEPLVDGLPPGLVRGGNQRLAPDASAEARVMRLKGYGNAIVPELAALFLRAVRDVLDPRALR